MSCLVYGSDETYWCNGSEVIEVRQGFLFCPTLEQAALRFLDGAVDREHQCHTHSPAVTAVPTSAGEHPQC